MDRSACDCVKSPFSVFTGSPAEACRTPGAAGLVVPPPVVPASTSPPADGASAAVAAATGAPSSTYGWPEAPFEAVKFAAASLAASYATGVKIAGQRVNASWTGHPGDQDDPA